MTGFLILLSGIPLSGQNTRVTNDTLTVLTFNLFGMPNSSWPARQTMILNTLREKIPDLMGFQEVIEPGETEETRAGTIADSLFAYTGIPVQFVYERTHFSWDRWFEGVALLTPHIILETEARSLPAGIFPRTVVWCRVLSPAGIVNFFTTHLSYGSQEPVRIQQVQSLKEFIAEKSADGTAVQNIVCGDFNAIPGSPPIRAMTHPDSGPVFTDSWALVNPGLDGFTMPSDDPEARIDYIFNIQNDEGTFTDSEIFFNIPDAEGLFPSDHLGVLSTVVTTNPKLDLHILSPQAGDTVSGEHAISWSFSNSPGPGTVLLYLSRDGGVTWREEWSGQTVDTTYHWNTLPESDGTMYRLRIAAVGENGFGMGQLHGSFIVNNPGNAAPELTLLDPLGGEKLQGEYIIRWLAMDADGDSLSVSIDLSNDAGISWTPLVHDIENSGSFLWDTGLYPNSAGCLLRIGASDGLFKVSVTSGTFTIQNDRVHIPETLFEHTAGTGDGFIRGSVVDSTRLTGHLYRITFNDSSFENTTYDVYDMDADSFVVRHASGLDGSTEGPLFHGLRLLVFDYQNAEVEEDSTGWTKGLSTLEFSISIPTLQIQGVPVAGIAYPSDYRITIFGETVDTTSTAFGFTPQPVQFQVWNLTEERQTEFLFSELDLNRTISDLDNIVLLEKDDTGEYQLGWMIFFHGSSSHIPPAPGDEFTLSTLKPFTGRDTFQFHGIYPTPVKDGESAQIPGRLTLLPNYPNPFNAETTITYALSKSGPVILSIFNCRGRKVIDLVKAVQTSGLQRICWDTKDENGFSVGSGIYFCRLECRREVLTCKMILIR
jgi:endonuclease/exonuclease/phosphatase family metal-dependent hydrolase